MLSRGKRITLSVEQDTWVYRMSGCGSASRAITVVINRADQSRSVSVPNGNYIDLWRDMPQSGGNLQIPARSILLLRSEPQ